MLYIGFTHSYERVNHFHGRRGSSCIYHHQRAYAHPLNFVPDRNVLFYGPRRSQMIFQQEILGALGGKLKGGPANS